MTRDEDRAKCIEAMARANHQAFDRLGPDQQRRLRKTAAKCLDSLNGIARVNSPVATDEMIAAVPSDLWAPLNSIVFDAMSAAGDLTNPPEKKP